MIPFSSDAVDFWDGMPDRTRFPWQEYTTTHPPKNARWRDAYVRIGAASTDFDENWSGIPHVQGGRRYAVPIRMSQAGQIRLLQVAAYNRDGEVIPVRFHLSFYYMRQTSVMAMPKVTQALADDPDVPGFASSNVGQHSPWVPDAWEEYNADGTLKSTEVPAPVRTAGLWVAYGNSYIKAGYYPGDGSPGDDATGMLVDESVRSFDTTRYAQFDPYAADGTKRQNSVLKKHQGMMYAMFYCDEQEDEAVFFLGRMFRVEPGTNVGGG